jgi:hypothetical protein
MIQRIQSVWLLIALTCGVLTFFFPFATYPDATNQFTKVMTMSRWYLMLLTILTSVGSLVTIFLYHDRSIQLKVNYASLITGALLLIAISYKSFNVSGTVLSLSCLLYIAIPIFQFLSIRGIRNDKEVVEDSEHLR